MHRSTRVILPLVVCLISLFLLQRNAHSAGSKKVNLAVPSISASGITPYVARELGYYRQEGFDVDIILMRAGLTIQALVAGSADYTGTPAATISAAVRGVKLVVLMAYVDKPLYDLVVNPELSSYSDLKGKLFGIGSLAGLSYEAFYAMLSKNALDPQRDVNPILIGPTRDRLAALQSNAIQATLLEPPYNFLALKEGYRKIGFAGDYFRNVMGALTTTVEKTKSSPDEVRRFVRATARGFLAFRDRKDVALPIMRRVLKLKDPQLAEQVYDYVRGAMTADGVVTDELARAIIETQKKRLKVADPVDPGDVFNFSFVVEAMKNLAVK